MMKRLYQVNKETERDSLNEFSVFLPMCSLSILERQKILGFV